MLKDNLQGQWFLLEGKGEKVFDWTGKGNNGAIQGKAAWKCKDKPRSIKQTTTVDKQIQDDDQCLQKRPHWGKKRNCATEKKWCPHKRWGKDMKDCCPCTCNPKLCGHDEPFTVKKFPLQKTSMYVKTVKMNKNAIENFGTLQTQLSKKSA
jgi:hypothetical protein